MSHQLHLSEPDETSSRGVGEPIAGMAEAEDGWEAFAEVDKMTLPPRKVLHSRD